MRQHDTTTYRGAGPWFWLRPVLAVAVSAVLFAAIIVLRWSVGGIEDSISMLYVLPVSLLALGFGFRVGLGAGVFAVGLLVLWVTTSHESLSVLGWLSRATPLLLLGALTGAATDRIRAAAAAERRAAAVALLQREAAEINDHILQQMAAAKWMLEAGRNDDGVELLESTMDTAQQLVSRMLGSDSVLPGDLRRSRPLAGAAEPLRSGW
jgi:K+-sensing histidine kinase KdpD